MDARILSALRMIRRSIVAIGLSQLAAFAAAPADPMRVDRHSVTQTPIRQLHDARPAQLAILAVKMAAMVPAKTAPLDPLPVPASAGIRADAPPHRDAVQQIDRSPRPLQVVLDQPRVRGPPTA